ncbi:PREDICTED: uncharacterized protein LOC109477179 [Branchiostoma belcheri]|uniref:Uncharacterized protein LOC109477179 n=1 Tax=Branchiostoma belcheri TaxID=7741 RepID=A0A6P4ZS92_BRABE|nr:PREDICTED: uncharacterized protein LOC109477179 [Branchiostoma belcheri]XP_019633807.1 PREDICTED: uncharacterized protein LOC109477179 [Branchiostoma belcheri]
MAYNGKCMRRMGWNLVVMGFLSITLGIAADATFASMGDNWETFHYISAPIWNGVFVVITGILAINSGNRPTSKDLMIAVMVLGICTILTALCCFSLAIVGSIYSSYDYDYDDGCNDFNGYCAPFPLYVVNALLTLPEVVMAFAAAIMPCCGLANNPNGLPVFGYNQLQDQEGPDIAPWHYGTMDPPPYMPRAQSTIGAAPAQPPAAGQPPSGPPSETIPKSPT